MLPNFNEYLIIQESVNDLVSDVDIVINENNLLGAISNPINFKKIQNNAKEYQKLLVQMALNDIDLAKRKEKADPDADKKDIDILNKTKNQAIKEKLGGVIARMDSLATTAILKKVVSMAKIKAKMNAANITLKAVEGEQLKRLKIKLKDMQVDYNDHKKALAEYVKDAKPDTKK